MKENSFILKLYAIISFVICGFCIMSLGEIPSYYHLLPILPFVMFVMSLITSIQIGNMKLNIPALLMFSVTLVRYCIIPFLMIIGGQHTVMKINIASNANSAIFLMSYECVAIYIAIIIAFKKEYNRTITFQQVYTATGVSKYVIFMTLYCIVMLVTSPILLDNYMTIFDLNKEEFTHAGRLEEVSVGSIVRVLRTLYSVMFNMVRIMMPVYIIGNCSKRIKSDFTMLFIVFFFVFIQFLMITATFAESIISALVILLAVSKLRKSLGQKIVRFAPYAVIGIIVVYFTVRYQVSQTTNISSMYSGNNIQEYICATVNAYFTGIDNVAASFNLPKYEIVQHFMASMQITIPFNTTLFGKAGEGLPTLYNSFNSIKGQIPATIGNGYYYFGPILAPLFSFCFAYFGIKYGIKAVNTPSYWKYICYCFIAIVFALGLGMYNEVIALGWINGWGIPMLLVVFLSEKHKSKMRCHEVN